jgi:hypothetical protein
MLPQLLRRFDFEIVNPSAPVKSYSAGIFIQSDMWCRVTKSTRSELRATGSSETK